jgi:hypothetical protein
MPPKKITLLCKLPTFYRFFSENASGAILNNSKFSLVEHKLLTILLFLLFLFTGRFLNELFVTGQAPSFN